MRRGAARESAELNRRRTKLLDSRTTLALACHKGVLRIEIGLTPKVEASRTASGFSPIQDTLSTSYSQKKKMDIKTKILELTTRYGKPAKFSAQVIASAVFPGSKELIELIGYYFDVVQGTAVDNVTADAMIQAGENQEVLRSLERIIDEISENQGEIMVRLSKFDNYADQERELRTFLSTHVEIMNGLQRALDHTGWNIELRLIRIEQDLKSLGSGNALSPQEEFEFRVFKLSRFIEAWLRESFGAEGNGLGALISSSYASGLLRDRHIVEDVKDFIPIRNSIIHDHEAPPPSPGALKIVEKLERLMNTKGSNNSDRLRIRTSRSQFFVDASGIGDFLTISEAIKVAGNGDEVFVLPGEYDESLFIDKEIRIIGQSDGQHRPKLISPGDMIQIFSNNVHIESLDLKSSGANAFGLIVFPDVRNIMLKSCSIDISSGTGLVSLRNSELIIEGVRVASCKYGFRIEGYGVVTKCGFLSCQYGVVARNYGQCRIGECDFADNEVDVYLDGGANGNLRSNVFQGPGFAIVAVNGSTAALAENDMTGCTNEHPTASLDEQSELTFIG